MGKEDAHSSQTTYRFKHLACNACRRRKLKCNGARPVCMTCKSTGRDCDWEDTIRKTGPRRGYVKSLEARLAEVESLLEQQKSTSSNPSHVPQALSDSDLASPENTLEGTAWEFLPPADTRLDDLGNESFDFAGRLPSGISSQDASITGPSTAHVSWDLAAIGLQEPLPSQEAINDLHLVFFEKIYPAVPIIHKGKYLAAMSLPATSRLRPPVCLCYAIWCLAASVSDSYTAVTEHFYHRARKYMDIDEIAGRGQGVVTLAHAQATAYLASFETRMLYFPRAWLSIGRAARLCQMMNLHNLDGAGPDVKEMLPSPANWVELEERRRVFWAVFVQDRYLSIGSGWPTIIDERDITTSLPASEDEFLTEQEATSPALSLDAAMTPDGVQNLSLFAAAAMISALLGRTLAHLHRKEAIYSGHESDSEAIFWIRHRYLDNILLTTLKNLPLHLQISACLHNPRGVLLHINIQAATICLHQAAIFKASASSSSSPSRGSASLLESKFRCVGAAETMMKILRVVDPSVVANIGPWLAFCLYLAARVFIQVLSDPPADDERRQSHGDALLHLMATLRAMKSKSPYTTSLLLQLERDMLVFGKHNPIGHIVVKADEISETLEQEKMARAYGAV